MAFSFWRLRFQELKYSQPLTDRHHSDTHDWANRFQSKRNETKRMTNGRSHLRIQKVQAETMPINNVYLKLLLNYICCLRLHLLEFKILFTTKTRCLSFSMYICVFGTSSTVARKKRAKQHYKLWCVQREKQHQQQQKYQWSLNAKCKSDFSSFFPSNLRQFYNLSSNHEFVATQQVFVTTARYLPTGKHVSFPFWVGWVINE